MGKVKEDHYPNVNNPFVLVESNADSFKDYNDQVLNDIKLLAKEDGFWEAFDVTIYDKESMKELLNYLVNEIIEINEGKNIDSKGKEGKERNACSCCFILLL